MRRTTTLLCGIGLSLLVLAAPALAQVPYEDEGALPVEDTAAPGEEISAGGPVTGEAPGGGEGAGRGAAGAAGGEDIDAAGPGSLASTGIAVLLILAISGALIATGTLFVRRARRTRPA